MMNAMKKLLLLILLTILLIGIVEASSSDLNGYPKRAAWNFKTQNGTYVDWNWYMDEWECAINDYYFTLHHLTGWNMPVIEYLKTVSPEDLATMPIEMYDAISNCNKQMFSVGSIMHGEKGTWQFIDIYHIWISPEGDVYSGDRPPYQWLVWKGWEEYADHLPEAPPGAPFTAPPYSGIPKNTLPIAKIPPHTGNFYGPMECPFPDAIADPDPHSEWDWTLEMKEALSALGLDTDVANTRLGYEKSGNTITMIGMTPAGTMKEWTLKRSKGAWTCDSADAEELEDMLVILERIDAITGTALATPIPTVTEKMTLTSLKSLNLNKLDTNTLKGVNSSKQQSLLLSGQSTTASIPDRSELLSESGTVIQQKSLVSAKIAPISQKVRRSIGSA
jgi:hypothetical protein